MGTDRVETDLGLLTVRVGGKGGGSMVPSVDDESSSSATANPLGGVLVPPDMVAAATAAIAPTLPVGPVDAIGKPVRQLGEGLVTIPNGRKVYIKEPSGSVQFRLALLIPSQYADNQIMVNLLNTALYVTMIDGVPCDHQTFSSIQATIDRLEDEGIAYLQMELNERYPASDLLKAKSARIKNLS